MADFLSEQLGALEKRLKDLRPQVEEYLHLEQVKEALEGVGKPRRGPGRPRGSTTRRRTSTSTARRRSTNGRRRRGRRGGTRAQQALKVVRDNPGITVSDLARKLNIKQPNYLYRVMNQLQAEGAVTKSGRGYTAK
ncbi:MAG: winged helix-turn-helix domain-containing protein [Actinobacteria bacterium]|nr:MAG: winged helix-turn-helix domain-containing protein [Actinomycetota bacterium]TML82489.1 MAG: winged helix-turn-helix domain-containing protein [Actinomycetota bacterium]